MAVMKTRSLATIILSFGLLTVCISTQEALAQERAGIRAELKIPGADNVQIIKTDDGSVYIGRITQLESDSVQFQTDVGMLTIPIVTIESCQEVPSSQIRDGKYWFPNPNGTRLLFTTTGQMLKKGKGYFSDIWIFFPSINYGITDRVSMGVGMSIIPGVEFSDQLLMFTPKVGVASSERLNIAVGALILKQKDIDSTLGILYGVGTLGSPDSNFTVGLGYGFSGGDVAQKPVVMLGGQTRISRKLALVTENWFVPGLERPFVSYGGRFMGETISVDLAFVTMFVEDAPFPGVPFIDFVVNF